MFLDQQKIIYELPQDKKRALIPKIVILIVLAAIFYLGILVNVALLELKAPSETLVKIISLAILLVLIIVGIFLSFQRAKKHFLFYKNKINFQKKEIFYNNILNTTPQQDFFDKIFHTYKINLGHHFHLRHIPEQIKIQDYLQQLINYSQQN